MKNKTLSLRHCHRVCGAVALLLLLVMVFNVFSGAIYADETETTALAETEAEHVDAPEDLVLDEESEAETPTAEDSTDPTAPDTPDALNEPIPVRGKVKIDTGTYSDIPYERHVGGEASGNFPWMKTEATGEWVYCFDYGQTTATGSYDGEDLEQVARWRNFNREQRTGIMLAALYGAGSNGDRLKYVATQWVIWEYSNFGRRSGSETIYSLVIKGNYASTIKNYRSELLAAIAEREKEVYIPLDQTSLTFNGTGESYAQTVEDTNSVLGKGYWKVTADSGIHAVIKNGKLEIYPTEVFSGERTVTIYREKYEASGTAISYRVKNQWAFVGYPQDPFTTDIKITVNPPEGTMTWKKTSDDGNVQGYCFKLFQWHVNRSWYGKSDANGNIYTTDANYTASEKVYTFEGLTDGEYTILEVLSKKGKDVVWPESIRITVTNSGSTVYDKTYSGDSLTKDANGDCRLNKISITGLSNGGKMTVAVKNKPVTVPLEIVKTSDDGKVDGITFLVEQFVSGSGWSEINSNTTDAEGRIIIPNLGIGQKLRVTETVPEGYIGETPVQEITLTAGTNTLHFENRLIRGSLKIVKVDEVTRTPLAGAGFRLYNEAGEQVAEGRTDENGELLFESLAYGSYTWKEFEAPEGFALDETEHPLEIREDGAVIEVEMENQPKEGSLTVCKVDNAYRPLSGVSFRLEYSMDHGSTWAPVRYRDESDPVEVGFCTSPGLTEAGTLTTGKDGVIAFTGLSVDTGIEHVSYRLTETETQSGYQLLTEPVWTGSLPENETLDLSFTVVNMPEFTMPATGGTGFAGTAVAVVVSGIALAAICLLTRKKKLKE